MFAHLTVFFKNDTYKYVTGTANIQDWNYVYRISNQYDEKISASDTSGTDLKFYNFLVSLISMIVQPTDFFPKLFAVVCDYVSMM